MKIIFKPLNSIPMRMTSRPQTTFESWSEKIEPSLRERALTHSSISRDNNERLELLGNGVLNLAIADILYHRFPWHVGRLSKACNHLRSNRMLNKVAWEIGLDIEVKFVPNKDDKPAKSIMAGCLEAVIGAIFESAGYETARAFVNEVLLDKHIFEVLESVFDPITDLHELVAIERWEPKVSKSVIEVGEDRVFRHVIELNGMIATGDGLSRKWAEWEASRKMLSQIKERMIEEKKNRSTPST